MAQAQDTFTFTVGKLDAGMAILLGERAHLIEFPSVLLPPGASAGSIVNISVHQNHAEEEKRDNEFWSLQEDILQEYGQHLPAYPELQLRHITQTSVTLEWPTISLAKAKLRSLDIYRKGQRLAAIPNPLTNTSTKVSGLELNTDYDFQLILRTTAGVFPSNILKVHTHTMTDTSGINVCFGNVQDPVLLENAKMALEELGAKWNMDKIEIDTTHFICTTPAPTPNGAEAAGNAHGGAGVVYQRALQLSIPIVQPNWILACHAEKRMAPVAPFYLGANPVPSGSTLNLRHQSMSQANLARSPPSQSPKSPSSAGNRSSLPPPARTSATPRAGDESAFINQHQPALETTPEDAEHAVQPPAAEDSHAPTPPPHESPISPTSGRPQTLADKASRRKSRHGTMDRAFKFPDPSSPTIGSDSDKTPKSEEPPKQGADAVAPSSIEVPPPPPVEKERTLEQDDAIGDDEVGETVEVPL